MTVLLQIDFKFPASEMGGNLSSSGRSLAVSITKEPGFLGKIWTENEYEGEAGGIYLFTTLDHAAAYASMHAKRVEEMGASNIRVKLFTINQPLTEITRGIIDLGQNL